ncbi:MAG: hypothetical protein WC773_03165 [Patescibacteria group bacterium]
MQAGLRCVFPPAFDETVLEKLITIQLPPDEYWHNRRFDKSDGVAINNWGVILDDSFTEAFRGIGPIILWLAGNVTVCNRVHPKERDTYQDVAGTIAYPVRSLSLARVWQYLHVACRSCESLISMGDTSHAFIRVPNRNGAHVVVCATPDHSTGKSWIMLDAHPLDDPVQANVLVYAS